MKKQAVISFFILVSVSSLNAQSISSATQVVAFGVRSSVSRQATNIVLAAISSTPSADLKESSELQVQASSGKKITYRSNRLPSSSSGFLSPIDVTYQHRPSSQFRGERGLIVTITD
jgi:hypothetical protein